MRQLRGLLMTETFATSDSYLAGCLGEQCCHLQVKPGVLSGVISATIYCLHQLPLSVGGHKGQRSMKARN